MPSGVDDDDDGSGAGGLCVPTSDFMNMDEALGALVGSHLTRRVNPSLVAISRANSIQRNATLRPAIRTKAVGIPRFFNARLPHQDGGGLRRPRHIRR